MNIRSAGMLIVLAALWGASFLFIRIAAPAVGPLVLMDVRVFLAGACLCLYALMLRQFPTLRLQWKEWLLLGALNAAIPFTLIAIAVNNLNASLAAILNATTPLFTAIIAALWLKEPFSLSKGIGLLLGVIGVAVLVGWSSLMLTTPVLLAVGIALLGACFYGIGGVYAKRTFKGVPPLTLAIGQQLGAGILLLPLALTNLPVTMPTLSVIGAIVGLAVLSTAIGYLLYFSLIVTVGPTKTLTVTFLVPVFGIIWGNIFLGEPITSGMLLGLLLILLSLLLVTEVPALLRRQFNEAQINNA